MQHVSVFGLPQRGAREGKDSHGPPFGRQKLDLVRVRVPVSVYDRADIAFVQSVFGHILCQDDGVEFLQHHNGPLLWVGGDKARSSHAWLPDPYRPEGDEGPRPRYYLSIDNIQSTVCRGVMYEVGTSTGDPFAGRIRYARWPEGALGTYRKLRDGTPDTGALLDAIEEQGFEWGVSDGN